MKPIGFTKPIVRKVRGSWRIFYSNQTARMGNWREAINFVIGGHCRNMRFL